MKPAPLLMAEASSTTAGRRVLLIGAALAASGCERVSRFGMQHTPGPGAGFELTGRSRLTPAQMADLMAGLWYVGISTRAWPAGEVRGQIRRSTSGVHGV